MKNKSGITLIALVITKVFYNRSGQKLSITNMNKGYNAGTGYLTLHYTKKAS